MSDHSGVTAEPEELDRGDTEADAAASSANERSSLPLGVLGGCEVGEEEQRRLNEEFEEAFSGEVFAPTPQFSREGRGGNKRVQTDPRVGDFFSSEKLKPFHLSVEYLCFTQQKRRRKRRREGGNESSDRRRWRRGR